MFRGYENYADSGAPKVLVPQKVIKKYGAVSVNSENLGILFEEEFKKPAADSTIKMYIGSALGETPPPGDVWRNGWRTPYSNTYHIPVWSAFSGSITPMSKVIALGLEAARKQEQSAGRRLLATEISVASGGAMAVGFAEDIGGLAIGGFAGLLLVGIAKTQNEVTDPGRLQFGQTPEVLALRKLHDSDIIFANQAHLSYLDQK